MTTLNEVSVSDAMGDMPSRSKRLPFTSYSTLGPRIVVIWTAIRQGRLADAPSWCVICHETNTHLEARTRKEAIGLARKVRHENTGSKGYLSIFNKTW